MTKEEMLRQEERSILNDMDARAAKRNANDTNMIEQLVNLGNHNTLLKLENQKLIDVLKELVNEYEVFSNIPENYKELEGYSGEDNPRTTAMMKAIEIIQNKK